MISRAELEAFAQRFTDAVNARTIPRDLVADDARIENVETAVTDRLYKGHAGVEQWLRDLLEVFDESVRFEHEVLEAGPDFIVGRLRLAGRGSASGVPLDLRWIGVLWTRDGHRLSRAVGYATEKEAREALGLPPRGSAAPG